jgi:nitrite reductase/ring-hydroxylating ferredoxin subunit
MTDSGPHLSRRAALAAGAGAVTLAACGGGSSRAPAEPAAGQRVAELADIRVGEAIAAHLDGQDVIVARPTASTAACFSAVCTHAGCTVRPRGDEAVCPCHGSVFNALTGKVIRTPAPAPLESIPVQVRNGEVVTA